MAASDKLNTLLIYAILALATFIAYEPMRHNNFVDFDDRTYVTENQQVRAGLTFDSFIWAFTSRDVSYWHPLTWLSHMLDCQLYGLRPSMHHFTSLILHIANSLLLFLVFKRMTGSVWRSGFVAAMFALHPINVDSVAWVAERKNVLSTLFWLLTIWAYAGYARRGGWGRYLLTLLFYALGLLSKPMLVTLPFVLLLLDYWPLGRFRFERASDSSKGDGGKAVIRGIQVSVLFRLLREKIPLFVLSVVSVYSFYSSPEGAGIAVSQVLVPIKLRVANALVSYVNYIAKMIWPGGLAVYYPYPDAVPMWESVGALLLLVCVSVLVILALRRKPYLAIGWLWYLGALIPVIGLYQVGLWPATADRWAYVPLIGPFVIIAWGVGDLVTKWRYRRMILGISAGLVLVASTLCTRKQVGYWQNGITIFEHTISVTENNYIAQQNLGIALTRVGRFKDAIKYFKESQRILPGRAKLLNNLGFALLQEGKLEEAFEYCTEALEIEPQLAEAHQNLAAVLVQQGKLEQAVKYYKTFLQIKPNEFSVHNYFAGVLLRQEKFDEAIVHWTKSLSLNPEQAEIHNDIALALARKGRLGEAVKHYNKSIRLNPNLDYVYNNLGLTLTKQNKLAEALESYAKSLELKPDQPVVHKNIADILFKQSKFDDAVVHYTKAVHLKSEMPRVLNNLAWLKAAYPNEKFHDPNEAVQLAQRAAKLTGYKNPGLLDTLSVAYAAAGKLGEAIETAEKARELALSLEQNKLAEEIKKHLKLYKSGQPWQNDVSP